MAWCPFATRKELPESKTQPTIAPRTIILHSAVSSAASLYPFFSGRTGLESHFYVANDGRIEQYVDTTRRADANNKANAFAVSIETADHGDPDSQPWNDAQLWAIERLVKWIATTHRVPLRRCPSWVEGGIGYHTMFGAPSPWTPVVKTCPGRARILQFNSYLMPRLAGQEDDMTDEERWVLADLWVRACYARNPNIVATEPDVNYWIGQIVGRKTTFGGAAEAIAG